MATMTSPRIRKISPQLLVTDMERSIEFYVTQLGFDVDFRFEDFYSGLTKDGCSIHLKTGNPSAAEREQKRKNEDLDIVFSVEGIEDFYKMLSDKSVQFLQNLRSMDYGREFYIMDPDGYIIAFLEEA